MTGRCVYQSPTVPNKWRPAAVPCSSEAPKTQTPDEPQTGSDTPPEKPSVCRVQEDAPIVCYAEKPRGGKGVSLGLARAVAVAALCLLAFVCGCAVSDSALCRMLLVLGAVTSGRLPENDVPKTQATVYDRFRETASADISSQAASDSNALSFLTVGDNEPVTEFPSDTVIAVQAESGGKIVSDGEVWYPVFARDLSVTDVTQLSNQTHYAPDTQTLADTFPKALEDLAVSPNEPLVLILHTHGTESYNDSGREGYYAADAPVRDENTDNNVVSVGNALAEVLSDFGIPVVHSTKMCDADSFIRAYSVSAAEAKTYLAAYPSVRIVIDLHRDAIESADGSRTKPVFTYAGEPTAQLMFVVGTDESGNNHPYWKDNLNLALYLQKRISEHVPGLFRRTNLRAPSFNEQYASGYLLLECGSCANTREEAVRAVRLFGTELARILLAED